jgi:hypothetical protein
MSGTVDPNDSVAVLAAIRAHAAARTFILSSHAADALDDDAFVLDDLIAALAVPRLLENYPDAQRGACCLILGWATDGRSLHAVVTTTLPHLLVITVYEPKRPKWISPTQRR